MVPVKLDNRDWLKVAKLLDNENELIVIDAEISGTDIDGESAAQFLTNLHVASKILSGMAKSTDGVGVTIVLPIEDTVALASILSEALRLCNNDSNSIKDKISQIADIFNVAVDDYYNELM